MTVAAADDDACVRFAEREKGAGLALAPNACAERLMSVRQTLFVYRRFVVILDKIREVSGMYNREGPHPRAHLAGCAARYVGLFLGPLR